MNRIKIIFLGLIIFDLAHAQINLSFNITPYPKTFNPIPLRDSIPNSLVKTNQNIQNSYIAPLTNIKLPFSVTVETKKERLPTENKIQLQVEMLSTEKTLDNITKKVFVSPKMLTLPNFKISSVGAKKIVFDNNKELPAPTVVSLDTIKEPLFKTDHVQLSKLIDISTDEYKMIHALLMFEFQKKYDTAMSLFVDLMNSSKFKIQAMFHYAEIAADFNLNSEFKSKMFQILKQPEDTIFKKKAVESLVKNSKSLVVNDIPLLDPEISKYNVSTSKSDYYWLKRGKYFANLNELALAQTSIEQINLNSAIAVESRILLSNVNYRLGDLNSAIKNIEAIISKVSNDRLDKFRNLSYLTLARLQFQKGNYKQAYANYLLIDKGSSFWLQSTTEQALTQILAGDYIGAAGNMFSLHTEYFKKAYSPESYVIRAIGYLNLCQFGDAVSVVAELQKRYTKLNEQLETFQKVSTQSPDYYNLVRDLFNKPDQIEVSGVPRAFVLELARHPSFIAVQKNINNFEDELSKFSKVAAGLAAKGNSIRQNITQVENDILSLRTKKTNDLQLALLERKILGLESEFTTASTGREKIEKMKTLATERIGLEKSKLKTLAGDVLKKRFDFAKKELTDVLDQKDVLAYEIYSGAGEHLRYQMAGGETKERAPASALTPEEKQSYKWKFKGEVWEDEIGHYRSSLTNVCSKDDFSKNAGGK